MLETLTKIKKGMNFVLSRIAAVLLSAMTLLVLYQVFTRYVLNSPAAFTEEVVRYLLIWTGFIGAAYAFSTRQHMALVIVRDKVSPGAKKGLMVFVDALILLFAVFVVIIGGTKLALSAVHEYSALLGISRGLVYAMAPVAGVFIVLAQVINLYEDVTGNVIEEEKKHEYSTDNHTFICSFRNPAVYRLSDFCRNCNFFDCNGSVYTVLGSDYFHYHAENEQRCGEFLSSCSASVYPGR